jgi:hypothetical protein
VDDCHLDYLTKLKKKKNKQKKHWYPVMTAGPIVYLFIYLAEISYLTLEKKIN